MKTAGTNELFDKGKKVNVPSVANVFRESVQTEDYISKSVFSINKKRIQLINLFKL